MKHRELKHGTMRAFMDAQLDPHQTIEVEQHIHDCPQCQAEMEVLGTRAARVSTGLDALPLLPDASDPAGVATAWAGFQRMREQSLQASSPRWNSWKVYSLAGGGLFTAALVVVLTVAPVRAWAESLLAIFRVEHFTVLELNPDATNNLQNNQLLNQTVSHILSDEVTVTQAPQKPQPVADGATASRLAGFNVKLLTDRQPSSLLLQSGAAAQMKLDRDHLQTLLDETGRTDLKIPASVDGAILGFRIPPGVMASYGNCGKMAPHALGGSQTSQVAKSAQSAPTPQPADATCVTLMQLPSPTVSAPSDLDPAQIAQVALQFLGMSANDAASFTQTVDWTSTLVLPVMRGQSVYEQLPVNGNEGVLLRPRGSSPADSFALMWVDGGVVYALNGIGDDTTALNLASQLQ
jgi:hypothetical protein